MERAKVFQISLASLMQATACVAVVLALLRLYPSNPLGLITPELDNLPLNALLNATIIAAAGGLAGAFGGRFWPGLALGAIIGVVLAGAWAVVHFFLLAMAAASV